jgi:hypothetical protein
MRGTTDGDFFGVTASGRRIEGGNHVLPLQRERALKHGAIAIREH